MSAEADTLREEIRRRYADAATVAAGGQQAVDGPADACFGTALYDDLDGLPEHAGLASLGCGNPIAVADIAPGATNVTFLHGQIEQIPKRHRHRAMSTRPSMPHDVSHSSSRLSSSASDEAPPKT